MDLNADLGEGMDDAAIVPFVTSANVACGLHAGNPAILDETVRLAHARGVRVGAHPGHADRENFGRIDVPLDSAELRALLLYQLGALDAVARARGVRLAHVKAHGALYNRAARDAAVARTVAEAVRDFRADLILIGLAGSVQLREARAVGLRAAGEAFVDRRYLPDGSLAPRNQPGAVLHDPVEAVEQALGLAREGRVRATDGSLVRVDAETLCLHGDTPGAAGTARRVRMELESAGIAVAPL